MHLSPNEAVIRHLCPKRRPSITFAAKLRNTITRNLNEFCHFLRAVMKNCYATSLTQVNYGSGPLIKAVDMEN